MRIIAGHLRGQILNIPTNKNTRPLKDMVRESIFNLLNHSNKISFKIKNSNVLDLYAGTGSFGLECLSREAKYVNFVENEKVVFNILQNNIEKLNIKKKTKIFFNDVFELIEKESFSKSKFDLIFCDPPFKYENIDELFKLIKSKNLLKKNGVIILHRSKNLDEILPKFLEVLDVRVYGLSKIIFGKFLF